MPKMAMESIVAGITALKLPAVDAVIGIERGGLIPGAIVAAKLGRRYGTMRVHFRDDSNRPVLGKPQLIDPPTIPLAHQGHVLLVDDVSVTGATFEVARRSLGEMHVTTVALIGQCDIVVFPDLHGCVRWPWTSLSDPSTPF